MDARLPKNEIEANFMRAYGPDAFADFVMRVIEEHPMTTNLLAVIRARMQIHLDADRQRPPTSGPYR